MSLFSKEYLTPDTGSFPLLNEGEFREHFQGIVQDSWVSPLAALSFTHAFLHKHGQRGYLLTLAGGALRDAYVALKYLNFIGKCESFHTYKYWDIFWDFMHYWVKDYDIWVHIDPEQKEDRDPQKDAQILETYRNNIYKEISPDTKFIADAYQILYNQFYMGFPSPLTHAKEILEYFLSPDYFLPHFSYFGRVHSEDAYKEFFPDGITHLISVDIPLPYLLDEKHIGSYVSQCSHFLPNMPIPISLQIMLTTKSPEDLLSSFDWSINRFGWTVDPFVKKERPFGYRSVMWEVPKLPFQFCHKPVLHNNPLQTLMRMVNLAAKYSNVPLEIQRKYPKIAWKSLLKKMHRCEKISFQLSDEFLYEIVCKKLFGNDGNK